MLCVRFVYRLPLGHSGIREGGLPGRHNTAWAVEIQHFFLDGGLFDNLLGYHARFSGAPKLSDLTIQGPAGPEKT